MTITAFILILASVVLHALWHFISKSRQPVPAFFIIVSASCLCTTLPFALTSGVNPALLPPRFYWMMIGGGVCGMICDIGLSRAYRLADVSLAYPLARALPVIMTALVTIFLGLGARPSALAIFGMLVIMMGCVLMPMKSFSAGTTGYTIFDSEGLRLLLANENVSRWQGAATYSCMREMVLLISLSSYVLSVPHERARLTKDLFCHPHPYFAGVFAAAAYLLVLIAMGFVSNVSFIQAFRQMSLPVSVLLGMVFLKEKCSAAKLTGVALIVAGLILTVLK